MPNKKQKKVYKIKVTNKETGNEKIFEVTATSRKHAETIAVNLMELDESSAFKSIGQFFKGLIKKNK